MTTARHTTSKLANVTHANRALNSQKGCVKTHCQWRTLSKIIIAKLSRKMCVSNVIMGTIWVWIIFVSRRTPCVRRSVGKMVTAQNVMQGII